MYTPDEIAEHQFLISLRGYDRDEVSAFLDEIAGQVRRLQQRIAELESKADERREEEQAAPPQDAPSDEAVPSRSFREVGEQTARILETAEQTAEEMRSRAERRAQEVREEADRIATEQREEAAREAARLREEAERDATQRREQADEQAEQLLEEARRKAREEQERANQTATEVLEDARRSARETLDTAEAEQREIAEQVAELRDSHARLQADLEAVSATVGQALDRLAGQAGDVPEAEGPEPEVEVPGPGPAVATDVEGDVAEEPPGGEARPLDDEDHDQHEDHGHEDHDHEDHDQHGADEATIEDEDQGVVEEVVEVDEAGEAPHDVDAAPAVADVASRELREQALTGIRPGMLRRLKRTLQDVQNGVLDALRREGADADVTRLLPGDDELAPLLSVGEAFLGEAYRAGLGDGATLAAISPDEAAADGERIAAAAAEFRATVGHETVAALEPSLAAGLDADEDESALADRVSEVFRDLKGPVAESATEASLLRIYELGTHDAWQHAGVETRIWVVGEEVRCPENRCRANADEGPVPFDRPFASGDVVPPAHGGCTCTLAPS